MSSIQIRMVLLVLLALSALSLYAQETDADIDKANSYDNAWENEWVNHLRTIHARSKNKTEGFVVHLGDSITCAPPYGYFAEKYRSGKPISKTVEWSKGGEGNLPEGTVPPSDCKNGWALAGYRFPGEISRSFTASCGMTAGNLLNFPKNDLASGKNDKAPLDTLLNNTHVGPHPDSAEGYHVAIIQDACMAVVMLGTNDITLKVAPDTTVANLRTIIEKLEAKDIMVLISTIPPYTGKIPEVEVLNNAIRKLAQEMNIPMIDLYAEILRRCPGESWQNTIMSDDGVHPSWRGYQDPISNPKAFNNNGLLLRGFLSIAKIHEVKSYIYDKVNPPNYKSTGPNNAPAGPSIMNETLPDARIGQPYSVMLQAEGGTPPYKWKKITLPRGLKLSPTGELSGKLTKKRTYKIFIKMTDAKLKTVRKTLMLKVQ